MATDEMEARGNQDMKKNIILMKLIKR